jgi:hypothetical protein
VGRFVKDTLEFLGRFAFVTDHGIVVDCTMTSLHFCIAGHVVDDKMVNAQAFEP